MFYKISSKSRDLVYAVAWCEGDEPTFQAIFYYLYGKEWRYVGPKLKDIIVGYDPDEDWEWGFHIIDDDAEKITKEEAEKICNLKIDEEILKSELHRILDKIQNPDGTIKVDENCLKEIEKLNI